jgi:peptidoglycan/LPS O-acetylase OafA/YrhL
MVVVPVDLFVVLDGYLLAVGFGQPARTGGRYLFRVAHRGKRIGPTDMVGIEKKS